jgi:uroporphyrinogen-III synthase
VRPGAISIGPVTSATMKQIGMPVDLEAKEASLDSLVDSVIKRFGKEIPLSKK